MIKALTIVLKKPMKDEQLKSLKETLLSLDYVAAVDEIESDFIDDGIIELKVKSEIRQKLWEVLE